MKKLIILIILIILISTQAYAVRFKTQLFEVVAVCIYRNVMFVTINLNGGTSSVMTSISCNVYKKGKFKPLLLNQ